MLEYVAKLLLGLLDRDLLGGLHDASVQRLCLLLPEVELVLVALVEDSPSFLETVRLMLTVCQTVAF